MRKAPLLLALALLLASCGGPAPSGGARLQDRLENPLVAERYWAEMAEHMADFIRLKDPLATDPVTGAIVDAERRRALQRVETVRTRMAEGMRGSFLSGKDEVKGSALLLEGVLYFGTEFLAYPEPEAHVYLTTVVDPRDVAFPDATAADLGALQTPYGAQEYVIPENRRDPRMRTVVLYDRRLETILGLAQLSE